MILNLDKHPPGECFRELDDALVAMGRGDVCLNAHVDPGAVPEDATVWNFENEIRTYPKAEEVWSFSERQAKETGRKHVPVGYHPSMERFGRAKEPDLDVVFMGCVNERRMAVFKDIAARGYTVTLMPPGQYGAERDAKLARAKLVVVPLYYPDGMFCSLRAAHLVANRVPCLFEAAPEMPRWAGWHDRYEDLAGVADMFLGHGGQPDVADALLEEFRDSPLVLP